jgi:hypothetical protein
VLWATRAVPTLNPRLPPQASTRCATVGAGCRHNPCGSQGWRRRASSPLLPPWQWLRFVEIFHQACRCASLSAGLAAAGRGGRRRTQAFILPTEGGSRLLGSISGAAASPPRLGVDPRPWWPGMDRQGSCRVDPMNLR